MSSWLPSGALRHSSSFAGSAISVVTTFGYGGFLLGPPLVGGLAEVVGLRAALGVIVVAGLVVFILSLRLREDQQKSVTS